jgi:hypothetical protein
VVNTSITNTRWKSKACEAHLRTSLARIPGKTP